MRGLVRTADQTFFLRRSEKEVDVYDPKGSHLDNLKAPQFKQAPEIEEGAVINHEELTTEAREIIGNPNLWLVACVEGHANASAVDHSNFMVMCRCLIMEADKSDLEHMYVVDSHKWPCRVTSLFADISALSTEMQDAYLERYTPLKLGTPLNQDYHKSVMADHLARLRYCYVTKVIEDCGYAADLEWDIVRSLQAKWMLASQGAKYKFAQHLVDTLYEGIKYEKGCAEMFTEAVLSLKGADVLTDFKKHLHA